MMIWTQTRTASRWLQWTLQNLLPNVFSLRCTVPDGQGISLWALEPEANLDAKGVKGTAGSATVSLWPRGIHVFETASLVGI